MLLAQSTYFPTLLSGLGPDGLIVLNREIIGLVLRKKNQANDLV
jgi:hypothetical protein